MTKALYRFTSFRKLLAIGSLLLSSGHGQSIQFTLQDSLVILRSAKLALS